MTSYHIESIPDGWAVFDSAGKQYGSAHRRQDAKQLLAIRRRCAPKHRRIDQRAPDKKKEMNSIAIH